MAPVCCTCDTGNVMSEHETVNATASEFVPQSSCEEANLTACIPDDSIVCTNPCICSVSISTGTADDPVPEGGDSDEPSPAGEGAMVDSMLSVPSLSEIAQAQLQDPELCPMLRYIKDGVLPEEKKLAKKLIMERSRFYVIDQVLYYEHPDDGGKWKIAILTSWQDTLIKEVHVIGSEKMCHFTHADYFLFNIPG